MAGHFQDGSPCHRKCFEAGSENDDKEMEELIDGYSDKTIETIPE